MCRHPNPHPERLFFRLPVFVESGLDLGLLLCALLGIGGFALLDQLIHFTFEILGSQGVQVVSLFSIGTNFGILRTFPCKMHTGIASVRICRLYLYT